MSKKIIPPGTMVYPLPAVLVSCGATPDEYNIITISWTGTICSKPPLCYISVRPNRHSYNIIKKNMGFVINLTTENLLYPTDWCGVNSGKDYRKFDEMKLTPVMASQVLAPMIEESPVSIECKVSQIIPLGSHDMFMAEVLAIHADGGLIKPNGNSLDLKKAKLISYAAKKYFSAGNELGQFGYSLQKKK